jgi:NAD(P)-dependent dehydrogenase (short-subunit alcohol dehydrogenase family)
MKNVMEVNFFGTLNCIKTVEQYFKDRNDGHISIVSSIAGYRGLPNSTGYGASKAALNNLAESLYFDFGRHNVRISLISPGFIKTPMTDKNEFKMPFLKTPEFAADKIYNGLINGSSFEIDFPKELTLILKFLKLLPDRIYFSLIKILTKYQKR